jgi:hypothetical protein
LFTAMTGIFTPAYSVSKRTGSDGLVVRQAEVQQGEGQREHDRPDHDGGHQRRSGILQQPGDDDAGHKDHSSSRTGTARPFVRHCLGEAEPRTGRIGRNPGPPCTAFLLLPDRELLGLGVQVPEPHRTGGLWTAEPEHVEALGDAALVDEVVVPVGGPVATDLTADRDAERPRVGSGSASGSAWITSTPRPRGHASARIPATAADPAPAGAVGLAATA